MPFKLCLGVKLRLARIGLLDVRDTSLINVLSNFLTSRDDIMSQDMDILEFCSDLTVARFRCCG